MLRSVISKVNLCFDRNMAGKVFIKVIIVQFPGYCGHEEFFKQNTAVFHVETASPPSPPTPILSTFASAAGINWIGALGAIVIPALNKARKAGAGLKAVMRLASISTWTISINGLINLVLSSGVASDHN